MPASTDVLSTTSRVGFGTWAIGGVARGTVAYGPSDDDESLAALREAYALGCRFFDTSNLYGWGHAETLLGQAFAGLRHEVKLATKAGFVTPDGSQDFSPSALRASLEGSLRRLRTSHVDLLQLHNPPPDVLAANEAWRAAVGVFEREGLARGFGISARTPDEALLLVDRYRPAAVQVNFNLGDMRALRNGLFARCRDLGIEVIVRTPLASGFLTGSISADTAFAASDHRRRYDEATKRRWLAAVECMRRLFDDEPGASPAQNALRFCLSFDAVSWVIPGMRRVGEVQDNLAAGHLSRLDAGRLDAWASTYDALFA